MINQHGEPPTGEYVRILYDDSEASRDAGRKIMRGQGCKAVRFNVLDSGALQVHGYLRQNDWAEAL